MNDEYLDEILEQVTPGIKILTADYEVNLGKYGDLVVPRGFSYNGLSVPTPLLFTVGSDRFGSRYKQPSLVHDYLYDEHYNGGLSRKDADDVIYDLLRERGVSKLKSSLMWLTVRLFGYSNYRDGTWFFGEEYFDTNKNIIVEDHKDLDDQNIVSSDVYIYLFIAIYIGIIMAIILFNLL